LQMADLIAQDFPNIVTHFNKGLDRHRREIAFGHSVLLELKASTYSRVIVCASFIRQTHAVGGGGDVVRPVGLPAALS
jgi:hypothetical protein